MKRVFLILIVLICLCLTGCGDKDYTDKDADKLAKSCAGIFGVERVDKETISTDLEYDNTLWTYREKGYRNVEFHVYENHYTTGVDSALWSTGDLMTDYDSQVLKYYLQYCHVSCDVKPRQESQTDFLYPLKFVYQCSSRQEVKNAEAEILDFLKNVPNDFVYGMSSSYNDQFVIHFKSNLMDYEFEMDLKDMKHNSDRLEKDICQYALSLQDKDILAEYSDAEISDVKRESGSCIVLDYGTGWKDTEYITLRGNTFMYPSAFYYLAQDEGLQVFGSPTDYTVIGYNGNKHYFGSNDFTLSFYDMQDILGCQVEDRWRLD